MKENMDERLLDLLCDTAAGNLSEDEARELAELSSRTDVELDLQSLELAARGVFQRLFGIVFQKVGDHVYDFTDRVVLHLSPGTLPYLSGMTFVNEGRIDFDQLLNNLYASGSRDHPAVVQNVLDELLYGWLYEVKTEFGAATEAEAVQVAGSLRK